MRIKVRVTSPNSGLTRLKKRLSKSVFYAGAGSSSSCSCSQINDLCGCCTCPEEPPPGGGTIQTDCCEALLPEILTATVTNKTGTCTCIPDTFDLVWDGFVWESEDICGVGRMQFYCEFDCFWLSQTGGMGELFSQCTFTCEPFEVVFTANFVDTCQGDATITITG